MKRLCVQVIGVFFLLATAVPLTAQPYHIEFSNFPDDPDYQKLVGEFFPVFKFVSVWTPEWDHDIPKEKVIQLLGELLSETDAQIGKQKKENEDLLLFRALLKACSFNLDMGDYYNDVIAELDALKKTYPLDYRPCWLLANHYAFSNNPFKAIEEYQHILKDLFQTTFAADVVDDYLTASYLALMFSGCKSAIDGLAEQNRITAKEKTFWMYRFLENQLIEPPANTVLPVNMMYSFLKRENGIGFLCRLFGIWLPVKESWKTKTIDTTREAVSSFQVSVPLESKKGRRIMTGITAVFQARPSLSFEEYQALLLKAVNEPLVYMEWKAPWSAQVYEFRNPALYSRDGGGHGFIVFVKRPEPRTKGLAIEAPSLIPSLKKDAATHYYVKEKGFTRFDGDIYYAFILDTCEDVFPESRDLFFDFLERILLD